MRAAWLIGCCWLAWCTPAAAEPALAFRIDEGRNINSFVREGPVAAHLLLRSGEQPRILVVFPAGNSGVGLWFAQTSAPVAWTLVDSPRPLTVKDGRGRPLHGVEFDVEARTRELKVGGAVLSSVRVLRDYELLGKAPPEVLVAPRASGHTLGWQRDRLDGAPGYLLSLEAGAGARVGTDRITAGSANTLRLRVRALTGEKLPALSP